MLPRSLGSYFKIHHVHSHAWKIRKLSLMALTQNKSIHKSEVSRYLANAMVSGVRRIHFKR